MISGEGKYPLELE